MNIKTVIKDIDNHKQELRKKGWSIVVAAVKMDADSATLCALGNPVDMLRGLYALEINLRKSVLSSGVTDREWAELKRSIYAEREAHELWRKKNGGSNDE